MQDSIGLNESGGSGLTNLSFVDFFGHLDFPSQIQQSHNADSGDEGELSKTETNQDADGGGSPDSGGGSEALDMLLGFNDNAGA